DFYAGGNRDQKTENRKNHAGINRLTRHKHVVAPNKKSENSDRHARRSDPDVAVDRFARKTGDQFTDHAHSRQNHDVDRRMRIEPEKMLEQNGIAAEFWIENSDAPETLYRDERKSDSQNWCGEDHDQA